MAKEKRSIDGQSRGRALKRNEWKRQSGAEKRTAEEMQCVGLARYGKAKEWHSVVR